jgi:hypothetical protein
VVRCLAAHVSGAHADALPLPSWHYARAAISGLTIPKSSTLVTSDRPIEDWGALLGDAFVQGS